MEKTVTIQQAAAALLSEYKRPLKSKELANLALQREMVAPSAAKDPIQSLSQTLERNIRLDKGNKPRLLFVDTENGRGIGLPEWYEERKVEKKVNLEKIEVAVPADLLNKIKLYQSSFNFMTIEETIVHLAKKGLSATSEELIERLKSELDGL